MRPVEPNIIRIDDRKKYVDRSYSMYTSHSTQVVPAILSLSRLFVFLTPEPVLITLAFLKSLYAAYNPSTKAKQQAEVVSLKLWL